MAFGLAKAVIEGWKEGWEEGGLPEEERERLRQERLEREQAAVEEEVTEKAEELDDYDLAVIEYNSAYTDMSDKGMQLYRDRERSVDLIQFIEYLVNSIANTPKEFETDFEEIECERKTFVESEEFARQKLDAARASATGGGAGVAAGAAVASMAPTAAMWIATTFGTASTGTAISTLSGAAATKAALAWLGGGALAAGGGGMAAGNALLAMAGPVGWTIAGASVLTSVVLFRKKKHDILGKKQEELAAIKANTEGVKEVAAEIDSILEKTTSLRDGLSELFAAAMRYYDEDYVALDREERLQLGALVNDTKVLAHLLNEKVSVAQEAET